MSTTLQGTGITPGNVSGGNLDIRSRRDNQGVMMNSPALALFTNPVFRAGGDSVPMSSQARFLLEEWMLGSPFASQPDQLASQTLRGVRERIESNPFEQVFPNVGHNGAGISVTRELFNPNTLNIGYSNVLSVGYTIPGLTSEQLFQEIRRTLETLQSQQTTTNHINFGSGNDIFMPGYLGNGQVRMGDGGDIYLASPHMFAAVLSGNSLRIGTGGKVDATILYPIAYALRHTIANPNGNSIFGEGGNDLIYYDSSIDIANGGTGDDIFAPSFGSFNWAIDTLIQGPTDAATLRDSNRRIGNFSRLNDNTDAAEEENILADKFRSANSTDGLYSTFVHGDAALISPVTQVRSPSVTVDPLYKFELERRIGRANRIYNDRAVLTPNANWGFRSSDSINREDPSLMNRLGGQHLIGGEGSDIFLWD
jgi:hypothetical protein